MDKTELPLQEALAIRKGDEVLVKAVADGDANPLHGVIAVRFEGCAGSHNVRLSALRGAEQSEGAGIAQKIIAMRERYQSERVDRDWTDWYDGGIETCNRILTMLDDSRTEQALHPSHVPALMHVVSMLDHGNTKVAREEAMRLLNEVRGRE